MKKILFLKLGPYFPANDLSIAEKYKILSENFEGDIIAVVNKKELNDIKIGKFRLRGLYLPRQIRYINILRNIFYSLYAITVSVYAHYSKGRYDVIIAYDPFVTGLLSFIIRKLTGTKAIVEVNGNYKSAFISNSKGLSFGERIKREVSKKLIPIVLSHADGIKLLYENQLDHFDNTVRNLKSVAIFHNFVPISCFKPSDKESKDILFMGFPWFLKGVDILIKAFNKISDEFPDYTLKIVGYCHDKTYFENLCNDNKRIQLCAPVHYHEAIELIEKCSVFVLPSRTEAMGRVLLESMAAKKSIIASNVDGIPTYIKHGFNGLLFNCGDVDDLAEKMKVVLGNRKFAGDIAENGYNYVKRQLSERSYLEQYKVLIEKVVTGRAFTNVRSGIDTDTAT